MRSRKVCGAHDSYLRSQTLGTNIATAINKWDRCIWLTQWVNVQLYGPVRKAPELTGASPQPDHAASSQQLATSQQLAYCLATPFTGECPA